MNQPFLSRRKLLQSAMAGTVLVPFQGQAASTAKKDSAPSLRAGFSQDETRLRLYSQAVTEPAKLLMLADTHLFRDDGRGDPYRQYSGRMSKAYNQTQHFRSKERTHPEACFEETLQTARDKQADALLLVGDIFSFPSEAAIEWVLARLHKSGLPWLYTAGNHDWHYEGMDGTSAQLRADWSGKRLAPLYQGREPLMTVQEIQGVRVIVLDNSTYEIQPEQLEFFRQQVAIGKPLVLCVHIPLYAPGRPVGFGCGHPSWGAQADKGYGIERRPKWRAEGHTQVTMDFHREVFSAPNLLGVFAGHTHQPSLDVINGIPQVVVGANATGAHLLIEVLPAAA